MVRLRKPYKEMKKHHEATHKEAHWFSDRTLKHWGTKFVNDPVNNFFISKETRHQTVYAIRYYSWAKGLVYTLKAELPNYEGNLSFFDDEEQIKNIFDKVSQINLSKHLTDYQKEHLHELKWYMSDEKLVVKVMHDDEEYMQENGIKDYIQTAKVIMPQN